MKARTLRKRLARQARYRWRLTRVAGMHDRTAQRRYLDAIGWVTLYHAYLEGVSVPRSLRAYRRADPFMPVPPPTAAENRAALRERIYRRLVTPRGAHPLADADYGIDVRSFLGA